ncbi:MAG: hypothetical protein JWQ25_1103 [Daejeonella sp.]|nr:hypothetical protein [Daejeonella sp.]
MKIYLLQLVRAISALLILFFFCHSAFAQTSNQNSWKSLFNGKDLKGWDTFLKPSEAAADKSPIGLNKDPHQVFNVVDGMIRISGQDWGGISTKESFSNYHIRFQIKWGPKKWPPRENALRDGGLLFHCSEPFDFGSKCWMRSVELQIQEGDMADYHNVGAGVPVIQMSKAIAEGENVQQYDPFAAFAPYDHRVYRSGNFESPYGEWTTGELVAHGADAAFIINGFVVNRIYNLFRSDLHEQVTSGRLQFQSEGSEHFLKNIQIRSIASIPVSKAKLTANKSQYDLTTDKEQSILIINSGESTEIIAVELLGKDIENFKLTLPAFPLVIKKGESINIKGIMKSGAAANSVKLKLETVNGPVSNFELVLTSR